MRLNLLKFQLAFLLEFSVVICRTFVFLASFANTLKIYTYAAYIEASLCVCMGVRACVFDKVLCHLNMLLLRD